MLHYNTYTLLRLIYLYKMFISIIFTIEFGHRQTEKKMLFIVFLIRLQTEEKHRGFIHDQYFLIDGTRYDKYLRGFEFCLTLGVLKMITKHVQCCANSHSPRKYFKLYFTQTEMDLLKCKDHHLKCWFKFTNAKQTASNFSHLIFFFPPASGQWLLLLRRRTTQPAWVWMCTNPHYHIHIQSSCSFLNKLLMIKWFSDDNRS